jgi:AAA+ ATPase superfamily predicted ATPase
MQSSPFIYGTTVSTHSFANREKERTQLKSNLLNGINTALISPRRWGKSSLVERVIEEIRKSSKSHKIVQIDLFSVSNEQEFLEAFAREVIKASSTRYQEWIKTTKEVFSRLIPQISFGIDPMSDFSLSFEWRELQKHRDEVLNLPERIAAGKKIHFIICLDEFQNLSSFNDYEDFEKKMRAVWQRQKRVTYCFYGSKRHMMSHIFNNSSKPFYRFGDVMSLGKISSSDWQQFIQNGFSKTGKSIESSISSAIPELMKNHSWYVQQLSHYVWNNTRKKAGDSELHQALNELLNANTPFYIKETESFSATQLNLLKAVVRGETQFMSAEVMRRYSLGTVRNAGKNKKLLIDNDVIQESEGRYEFLDPAYEIWFRKVFFREEPASGIAKS